MTTRLPRPPAGTFTATCKLHETGNRTQADLARGLRDIEAHNWETDGNGGQSARTFTDRAAYAAHMKLHGARPARVSGPPANNGETYLRLATSRRPHDPAVGEVGSWVTWDDGLKSGQVWAEITRGRGDVWVADGTQYHRVPVSALSLAANPPAPPELEAVETVPVETVTLEPAPVLTFPERCAARKAHNRTVLAPMLDEIRDGWRSAANRAEIWAAAKAGADIIPLVPGGDGGRQAGDLTEADHRFMADHVKVITVG